MAPLLPLCRQYSNIFPAFFYSVENSNTLCSIVFGVEAVALILHRLSLHMIISSASLRWH